MPPSMAPYVAAPRGAPRASPAKGQGSSAKGKPNQGTRGETSRGNQIFFTIEAFPIMAPVPLLRLEEKKFHISNPDNRKMANIGILVRKIS